MKSHIFIIIQIIFLLSLTSSCFFYGEWVTNQTGNMLNIAYGKYSFPQYACLHTDSGYFRLNYGQTSGWGTSVIILPSFWYKDSLGNGNLAQGGSIAITNITSGIDLTIDFIGYINVLQVKGKIIIYTPDYYSVTAKVVITEVKGNIDLLSKPGESFKPVMLSSMHISSKEWDTQYAYISNDYYSIPASGFIVNEAVFGNRFGLQGGSSEWKTNAPTIEIQFCKNYQIMGWVTESNNHDDDNIGFWISSDEIIRKWDYLIIAKP